jgi:hypothetical protein
MDRLEPAAGSRRRLFGAGTVTPLVAGDGDDAPVVLFQTYLVAG